MKEILAKYIIALLSLQPTDYIDEAHHHFSEVQDQYIAGPGSHPHITLCQFYTDESTLQKIKEDLKNLEKFPQPHFNGIHFVKDPKPNLWGAEISVARDPDLIAYQHQVVDILKKYNISCINDIGERYRPHLTLGRINKLMLKNVKESILQDTPFVLSIGRAGELGQFVKIIERIEK